MPAAEPLGTSLDAPSADIEIAKDNKRCLDSSRDRSQMQDVKFFEISCGSPEIITVTEVNEQRKYPGSGNRRSSLRNFQRSPIGLKFAAVLRQRGVQMTLAFALVTTLFLPDLWVIGNAANEMDPLMNAILLLSLLLFTLEIIVT
jgi:hypothetical protein